MHFTSATGYFKVTNDVINRTLPPTKPPENNHVTHSPNERIVQHVHAETGVTLVNTDYKSVNRLL